MMLAPASYWTRARWISQAVDGFMAFMFVNPANRVPGWDPVGVAVWELAGPGLDGARACQLPDKDRMDFAGGRRLHGVHVRECGDRAPTRIRWVWPYGNWRGRACTMMLAPASYRTRTG